MSGDFSVTLLWLPIAESSATAHPHGSVPPTTPSFIIGFSAAKGHLAMAPERHTMIHFEHLMAQRGTNRGKMFARQPWSKPFDYDLAAAFIEYQLETKAEVTSFWLPKQP